MTTDRLILFSEIIVLEYEGHRKQVNEMWTWMQSFLNFTARSTNGHYRDLKV